MPSKKEKRCIFCEIINKERAAHIVYEDDTSLAFLDYRPLYPGHVLLVPKEHHKTLMDLPGPIIDPLFKTMKLLSQAVELAMNADGIFNAINNRMSQSIPHIHLHIIPRKHKDNMRHFMWPRQKYATDAHMAETAESIRKQIDKLQSEGFSWENLKLFAEKLANLENDIDSQEYQEALAAFIKKQRSQSQGLMNNIPEMNLFSGKEKVKEILLKDKVLAALFIKEFIMK